MKYLISFVVLCLIGMVPARAQNEFQRYVNYSLYFGHPDANEIPYKNTPYIIFLTYKDAQGNELYTEAHDGTTDNNGFVFLHIGSGDPDPDNPFGLFTLDFNEVYKVCYRAELYPPEGTVFLLDEQLIGASPKAIVAENANALGNNKWVGDSVVPPFNSDDFDVISIPLNLPGPTPGDGLFNLIDAKTYFGRDTAPSAVNQTPLPYYQVGTGEGTPVVFGRNPLPELEGFETRCYRSDENLFNGAVFKFIQEGHTPLTHSTAAVYAENIYDPLGVGVFANGASRGSYNQGQNGMLGLTIGVGNGAASWSRVAVAPTAGGFKYGAFAEDQGLADSWAAAIFGRGFYTGTWSQSSDRRLKTEIRAQSNGLEQIMKLRPSQYRYIENTPYSLPDGIHHGFIAQEMEEVLPELVSDVHMPVSMDEKNLTMAGTTTYKAINYIELIPLLTNAIQELNVKVDAQAKEIELLKEALHAKANPK